MQIIYAIVAVLAAIVLFLIGLAMCRWLWRAAAGGHRTYNIKIVFDDTQLRDLTKFHARANA